MCQLLENLLDPLRLRCNSWACVAHLLIPGKSIPGNLKIPPQSGDVGFRTCKSLALEKGPHDGRIGHSLTGDGGRFPTGRYVGNRATLATDPSGLIVRQVGDFLWGVGQGIVEVPAMFLDLGHSVGALAYMEITGRPYIPTYLSMTAQAADRASVQGGREAIGEMLANAYFDLFTFGVRPLFQALQEAVHGNCEPLGQFSGMLIFGWAVGGGGFRPQQITLPEGPRPVLALAGGGEVALAAPGGLAIPVPHGLPMPIIVHMTVPDPPSTPNGQNSSQSASDPNYASLPEKGQVIGQGAEGTIYDLPSHPEWVLKEFHPGTVATQASNEAANLARLRGVFGDRHVVRTIEPPRRFAPGERVVLLKERVWPAANSDRAARDRIIQTLREKGMQTDVGDNLMWGTTAGDPTPRWIWIE